MTEKNLISRKQISINMIANIVSYSANIIIAFILTPFLINTLGKETYSFYPMANVIVSYISVLAGSLSSMASRFVTVSLVQEKELEANKYYSSTFIANLLMSAILFVPMLCIVLFLDRILKVPMNSIVAIKILFSFVFASALINISTSVFGIATFAKNRIDLNSLKELSISALRLILFFLLYRFLTPSIIYVGLVSFIIALINIVFQFNYTRILLPEIKISKSNFSWEHAKELLASSSWNAINSLGNIMLAGMSMILANIFFGAVASGSYSIVNTVPQFISGVIIMLIGVFYPVITHKYAQHDKTGLISEIKRAQKIVGIFGCAAVSVFSALAMDFFTLWTPGEDAKFLAILSFITIMPHFIISSMWSLTNLNIVMNKVKVPALFTLGCGVANLLIAYSTYKLFDSGLILLPMISSFLQIIWVGVFIPLYASKNLEVKWYTFYPPVIKLLGGSSIVLLAVLILKKLFILDSWFKFLLFGAISVFFAIIFFILVMFRASVLKEAFGKVLKSNILKKNER